MIEAVPLFRKSGALANNIRKPALNAWGQPTSRRLEVPRVADISNPVPGGGVPDGISCSIGINNRGTVAFGGGFLPGSLNFGASTDQGVVAQDGDMLPDGRTIAVFDAVDSTTETTWCSAAGP